MTTLFGRVVRIAAGPRTLNAGSALAAIEAGLGFDFSGLDCVFRVKKTLKPEPNTCELRVYNLADTTRHVLQASDRVMVRVEAGYEDAVSQLFFGEVRSAQSSIQGPDIITEISSGDSEKEMQTARVSMSIGAGTSAVVVLQQIADALGVGIGNALVVASTLHSNFFGDGSALFGNAAVALSAFCASADLEWSIQDGNLQLLQRGTALETRGPMLSAGTGLIGSPAIDHKGIVTASALIQPGIIPGAYVGIESLAFSGVFRVLECEWVGDTRGNDWSVRFTGKPPKAKKP